MSSDRFRSVVLGIKCLGRRDNRPEKSPHRVSEGTMPNPTPASAGDRRLSYLEIVDTRGDF